MRHVDLVSLALLQRLKYEAAGDMLAGKQGHFRVGNLVVLPVGSEGVETRATWFAEAMCFLFLVSVQGLLGHRDKVAPVLRAPDAMDRFVVLFSRACVCEKLVACGAVAVALLDLVKLQSGL